MVESSEVLIFPRVRISELEEQTRQARERFLSQSERTIDAARETLRPANLIAHHKGSLITSTVSLLLIGKLLGSMLKVISPKLKMSAVYGVMEAGWIWKALQYSYKIYKFVLR